MPAFERFIASALLQLEEGGLLRRSDSPLRERATAAAGALGRTLVDASSNDYLGFGTSNVSRETFVQSSVTAGAGASRLIHGTAPQHEALERELAAWVGLESALLFTTGYTANVGLLQALGSQDTVFVSDALNHASIIDGCRLSRARVEVTPHLSLEGVEQALTRHGAAPVRCVVTESYFSMDGDGPDLPALRRLCDRYDAALLVDEAHALGVFGRRGGGLCLQAGVVPDALVGTLGKAVGVQGAFVAGTRRLRELLWNRARSFVFSTAPSPLLAEVAYFHVQRTGDADGLRLELHRRCDELRAALAEHRLPVAAGSFGPIVPVLVGDERRTLRVVEYLASEGVLAQAIRPPTVPARTARVRLTVKASWSEGTPGLVAEAVAKALST